MNNTLSANRYYFGLFLLTVKKGQWGLFRSWSSIAKVVNHYIFCELPTHIFQVCAGRSIICASAGDGFSSVLQLCEDSPPAVPLT